MTDGNSSNNSVKTCQLCNDKVSKYCCPRCEVLYCSLVCYKSEKHLQCSESFYRDCINEELIGYQADDDSKSKMIDILKKAQSQGFEMPEEAEEFIQNGDSEEVDSDDDEGEDLHERIKNLNLNNADELWSALTEDEKNEFEALVNQGEVGSLVPQWEPWWMYSKELKLVQDVENKDKAEEDALNKCPALVSVPGFGTLTSQPSSPALKFNITNVIAAYVFLMRYFNGEIEEVEFTQYLLRICANLDINTNFNDLEIAVESVAQKCLQSELIETDELSIKTMKLDTHRMLHGPSQDNQKHYYQAAISDVHRILSQAKNVCKIPKRLQNKVENKQFSMKFPEHGTQYLPNLDVSKVKKCLKKLEYYLSYMESSHVEL